MDNAEDEEYVNERFEGSLLDNIVVILPCSLSACHAGLSRKM